LAERSRNASMIDTALSTWRDRPWERLFICCARLSTADNAQSAARPSTTTVMINHTRVASAMRENQAAIFCLPHVDPRASPVAPPIAANGPAVRNLMVMAAKNSGVRNILRFANDYGPVIMTTIRICIPVLMRPPQIMSRRNALTAALLAALAMPAASLAQSADQASGDGSSAKTLGAVHVTGSILGQDYDTDTSHVAKVPTAVRDIPQTVVVVNRNLLEAQGATSFQDALRNVPGITITAAEGGTIGDNVNLRGFSARTDIYLDGFRDRGQYYRDTFALESVEVLMGPSSMLFGRGSTGGVINQVSKKANLHDSAEVTGMIGTDEVEFFGEPSMILSE